jgi:C-terminal processing protease CtpA/Prc
MMLHRSILLLLLFLLTKISLGQGVYKHSINNLQQDFNILRGALEESHAGIYWYRTKAEMDKAFNAAYQSLDREMTELEYYRIIAPLISKIGCGHTWIATTEATQQKIWEHGKVLPLKLKFIENEAYCLQNNSNDSTSIQIGDQILSVNNYSIDSLLMLSNKFSHGDGFIEVGKWRILDNAFNQFFTLFVGQPDEYRIEVKKNDGRVREVIIQPLTLKDIESISKRRYPDKGKKEVENINLRFIGNNSVALLKVKEFSDWKIKRKKVSFSKELKRCFQKVDSSKTENLIIDLRDNDGGNEKYGLLLFSYLTDKPFIGYKQIDFRATHFSYRKYSNARWIEYCIFKTMLRHKKINDSTYLLRNDKATSIYKPSKNPFRGRIYVLTNRGSFSTTSDFTALVQSNKRGIFVGEETGGSYLGNTSNYSFLITLPNTKIKVNIPVARYQNNVTPNGNFGRGTIPDYKVRYSIDEIIQGIDKEINTVLNLIKD